MKKSLAFSFKLLLIIMMSALFGSISVYAEPAVLGAYTDTVIDDFEGVISYWTAGRGSGAVGTVTTLLSEPYGAYRGERALAVMTPSADISTSRTVNAKFTQSFDLSESGCFFFALNIPYTASAEFTVSITLTSEKSSFSSSQKAVSGKWVEIFTDISSWKDRNTLSGITISVRGTLSGALDSAYTYYIDCMGACKSTEVADALRYLITKSNYYTGGASASYENGADEEYMLLSARSDIMYIEPYNMPSKLFDEIQMLRVKLDNRCGAKTLSFYYTTPGAVSFSDDKKYTTALYDGLQNVYIPIPQHIRQFRISFDGIIFDSAKANEQTVQLYSITPVHSYIAQESGYGTIDECSVSAGAKEVIVSGTLSDTAYELYDGMTLELYELKNTESDFLITAKRITPTASIRLSKSYKFKIPLIKTDDTSRITNRFVVVINYGGSMIMVDSSYILNAESMVSPKIKSQTPKTIKGAQHISSPVAQTLGIGSTIIDIRTERLLSYAAVNEDEVDAQIKQKCEDYLFEGVHYYFDSFYITSLDRKMAAYKDSKILIYFRLTASHSTENIVNTLLCHPNSDISAEYCSFNTEDEAGISALCALSTFLAERYSTENTSIGARATGYIIGKSVNNAYTNYNMGRKTLADFTKSYACALRITANSIRAAAGNISIYASVSDNFDRETYSENKITYDTSVFLDALAAYTKNYGDLDWKIVLDMGSTDALMPTAPPSSTSSTFSTTIISNFENFCGYISHPQLMYKSGIHADSVRQIIVTSDITPNETMYAYSFFTLRTRKNNIVESFILSNLPPECYEIVRYIDTSKAQDISSQILHQLNAKKWSDIIPGADVSTLPRDVYERSATVTDKLNIAGTFELLNFPQNSLKSDYEPGYGIKLLTSGATVMGRNDTLMVTTEKSYNPTEYRGVEFLFDFPHDFSIAPYITFDIQITTLPAGISDAEITVMLRNGLNYALYTADVTKGKWNSVTLDLSDLSFIRNVDEMKIWVRGINGVDIGEPTLVICPVNAISEQYDEIQLENKFAAQRALFMNSEKLPINKTLIWILGIVIISCSTMLAISLLTKFRSGK